MNITQMVKTGNIILFLSLLTLHCFLAIFIGIDLEFEFGANNDVLEHIHYWWDVRPSQDRDVQIILIESKMSLPAKVERLV